jgi:hypothetical protein
MNDLERADKAEEALRQKARDAATNGARALSDGIDLDAYDYYRGMAEAYRDAAAILASRPSQATPEREELLELRKIADESAGVIAASWLIRWIDDALAARPVPRED